MFGVNFSKPDLFSSIFYANGFDAPRIPVITNNKPEKIQLFTWGLIPNWTANEDKAREIRFKTLNSRSDTLFTKASFRKLIKNKHCLILVEEFFDWREYKGKNILIIFI